MEGNHNKDNGNEKELYYKHRVNNKNMKIKGNCFVCGKLGHHEVQCRNIAGKNDNPFKPGVNMAVADDIIVAVISQANLVANMSVWVIDLGATRHICSNKIDFVSYTQVNEGEKVVS